MATHIITFETSHLALWAEDVARERGISVELGPAPPDSSAKCGLALRTPSDRAVELEEALRAEGIEFGSNLTAPS